MGLGFRVFVAEGFQFWVLLFRIEHYSSGARLGSKLSRLGGGGVGGGLGFEVRWHEGLRCWSIDRNPRTLNPYTPDPKP